MFVKTTKGIYELTSWRKIDKDEELYGDKNQLLDTNIVVEWDCTDNNGFVCHYETLGKVVAQSDNADDLISEIVAIDNKNRKVRIAKFQIKRYAIEFGDRIIALTWIGDDLLKTFEWDREKGEWKLYERN